MRRGWQGGLAFAAAWFISGGGYAQNISVEEHYASAMPSDLPGGGNTEVGGVPGDIDIPALRDALSFDPAEVTVSVPVPRVRSRSVPVPQLLDVARTSNPDGSGSVAVKTPLPTAWDTRIGADIALAADPRASYEPGMPLPGSIKDPNAGAAWASVAVPDVAIIHTRIARSDDRGTIGTTIRRSVPVTGKFSVTLEDSYSLTESFAAPATPHNPQAQYWGTEKQVKFAILPTGTTLSAGVATSSIDPVTHNKLSAEQKIYGPLSVTTSVTDIDQPISNKSITASFKLKW